MPPAIRGAKHGVSAVRALLAVLVFLLAAALSASVLKVLSQSPGELGVRAPREARPQTLPNGILEYESCETDIPCPDPAYECVVDLCACQPAGSGLTLQNQCAGGAPDGVLVREACETGHPCRDPAFQCNEQTATCEIREVEEAGLGSLTVMTLTANDWPLTATVIVTDTASGQVIGEPLISGFLTGGLSSRAMRPGDYLLTSTSPGYRPAAQPVEIRAGEVTFALLRHERDRGELDIFVANEKIGEPIEGADVEVTGVGGLTTDSLGYAYSDRVALQPGIQVTATANGYEPTDAAIVDLSQPGLGHAVVQFLLTPQPTTLELELRGIRDRPVPGAQVRLLCFNDYVVEFVYDSVGTTDQEGKYTFEEIAAPAVCALLSNHLSYQDLTIEDIEFEPGQNLSRIETLTPIPTTYTHRFPNQSPYTDEIWNRLLRGKSARYVGVPRTATEAVDETATIDLAAGVPTVRFEEGILQGQGKFILSAVETTIDGVGLQIPALEQSVMLHGDLVEETSLVPVAGKVDLTAETMHQLVINVLPAIPRRFPELVSGGPATPPPTGGGTIPWPDEKITEDEQTAGKAPLLPEEEADWVIPQRSVPCALPPSHPCHDEETADYNPGLDYLKVHELKRPEAEARVRFLSDWLREGGIVLETDDAGRAAGDLPAARYQRVLIEKSEVYQKHQPSLRAQSGATVEVSLTGFLGRVQLAGFLTDNYDTDILQDSPWPVLGPGANAEVTASAQASASVVNAGPNGYFVTPVEVVFGSGQEEVDSDRSEEVELTLTARADHHLERSIETSPLDRQDLMRVIFVGRKGLQAELNASVPVLTKNWVPPCPGTPIVPPDCCACYQPTNGSPGGNFAIELDYGVTQRIFAIDDPATPANESVFQFNLDFLKEAWYEELLCVQNCDGLAGTPEYDLLRRNFFDPAAPAVPDPLIIHLNGGPNGVNLAADAAAEAIARDTRSQPLPEVAIQAQYVGPGETVALPGNLDPNTGCPRSPPLGDSNIITDNEGWGYVGPVDYVPQATWVFVIKQWPEGFFPRDCDGLDLELPRRLETRAVQVYTLEDGASGYAPKVTFVDPFQSSGSSGGPLAGATVSVDNLQCTTDSEGKCQAQADQQCPIPRKLAPGLTYDLIVSKPPQTVAPGWTIAYEKKRHSDTLERDVCKPISITVRVSPPPIVNLGNTQLLVRGKAFAAEGQVTGAPATTVEGELGGTFIHGEDHAVEAFVTEIDWREEKLIPGLTGGRIRSGNVNFILLNHEKAQQSDWRGENEWPVLVGGRLAPSVREEAGAGAKRRYILSGLNLGDFLLGQSVITVRAENQFGALRHTQVADLPHQKVFSVAEATAWSDFWRTIGSIPGLQTVGAPPLSFKARDPEAPSFVRDARSRREAPVSRWGVHIPFDFDPWDQAWKESGGRLYIQNSGGAKLGLRLTHDTPYAQARELFSRSLEFSAEASASVGYDGENNELKGTLGGQLGGGVDWHRGGRKDRIRALKAASRAKTAVARKLQDSGAFSGLDAAGRDALINRETRASLRTGRDAEIVRRSKARRQSLSASLGLERGASGPLEVQLLPVPGLTISEAPRKGLSKDEVKVAGSTSYPIPLPGPFILIGKLGLFDLRLTLDYGLEFALPAEFDFEEMWRVPTFAMWGLPVGRPLEEELRLEAGFPQPFGATVSADIAKLIRLGGGGGISKSLFKTELKPKLFRYLTWSLDFFVRLFAEIDLFLLTLSPEWKLNIPGVNLCLSGKGDGPQPCSVYVAYVEEGNERFGFNLSFRDPDFQQRGAGADEGRGEILRKLKADRSLDLLADTAGVRIAVNAQDPARELQNSVFVGTLERSEAGGWGDLRKSSNPNLSDAMLEIVNGDRLFAARRMPEVDEPLEILSKAPETEVVAGRVASDGNFVVETVLTTSRRYKGRPRLRSGFGQAQLTWTESTLLSVLDHPMRRLYSARRTGGQWSEPGLVVSDTIVNHDQAMLAQGGVIAYIRDSDGLRGNDDWELKVTFFDAATNTWTEPRSVPLPAGPAEAEAVLSSEVAVAPRSDSEVWIALAVDDLSILVLPYEIAGGNVGEPLVFPHEDVGNLQFLLSSEDIADSLIFTAIETVEDGERAGQIWLAHLSTQGCPEAVAPPTQGERFETLRAARHLTSLHIAGKHRQPTETPEVSGLPPDLAYYAFDWEELTRDQVVPQLRPIWERGLGRQLTAAFLQAGETLGAGRWGELLDNNAIPAGRWLTLGFAPDAPEAAVTMTLQKDGQVLAEETMLPVEHEPAVKAVTWCSPSLPGLYSAEIRIQAAGQGPIVRETELRIVDAPFGTLPPGKQTRDSHLTDFLKALALVLALAAILFLAFWIFRRAWS